MYQKTIIINLYIDANINAINRDIYMRKVIEYLRV